MSVSLLAKLPPEFRRRLRADGRVSRALLPRLGVPLITPEAEAQALADRFRDDFRMVWSGIDLGTRRAIVRYWRHHPMLVRVEVLSGWRTCWKGTLAQCGFTGTEVRFRTDAIAYAYFVGAEDAVRYVIAHEMAHVAQWAYGWRHSGDPIEDTDWREEDADFRAERWGFDGAGVDDLDWPDNEGDESPYALHMHELNEQFGEALKDYPEALGTGV